MFTAIIVIHVLAATIWTGGHIVLATTVLPKILKTRDIDKLLDFEMGYEKVGMPALVIQIITGLYLAYSHLPEVGKWFSFSDHISTHIGIKLILLFCTFAFAINAKFRLIPNLEKGNNLTIFAGHIISVTILSILFVIVGLSFRLGIGYSKQFYL
jgi:putative copper export protein